MSISLVGVHEGSVDEDKLLGRVSFFSCPDRPVRTDDLLRAWQDNGLDTTGLDVKRRPDQVFQTACRKISGVDRTPDKRVEVVADEVENTPGYVLFQITRKVWDIDRGVIEHEKGLRLRFSKNEMKIQSEHLDFYDADLANLENQVRTYYDANLGTAEGQKVRKAVRALLLHLGGQNLRRKGGGVYFVPSQVPGNGPALPVLKGIQAAMTALYGNDADLYTLPCVNGEAEQEMVRKHTAMNLKADADRIVADIYARMKERERAPRRDLLSRIDEERRQILVTLKHFKQLVSIEEDGVLQSIRELDDALLKMEKFYNPTPSQTDTP